MRKFVKENLYEYFNISDTNIPLFESEMFLFEGKYEILQQKYVLGPESDPKAPENRFKITQDQYDSFFAVAKEDPKSNKYADSLLYLAVHSSPEEKKMFFGATPGQVGEDLYKYFQPNGYLDLYIKNYFVIKRNTPDFKNLINFKTLGNFKTNILKYKIEDTHAESLSKGERAAGYFLGPQDINRLKAVAIDFLGSTPSGYQCFKINKECARRKDSHDAYNELLAAGHTEWCTAPNMDYWKRYLEQGPLYVFIKKGDAKAPYQFHFESEQFMDKNDESVI